MSSFTLVMAKSIPLEQPQPQNQLQRLVLLNDMENSSAFPGTENTSSYIHLLCLLLGHRRPLQEGAGQVRIAIQAHPITIQAQNIHRVPALFWDDSHSVSSTLHAMAQAEKEVCLSKLRSESRTGPGSHTSQFPYIISLRIMKSGVHLETLGKLMSDSCNGKFLQYWSCKLRPQKTRGSQLSLISIKLTSPLSPALAKFLDILPRKQKLEHTSVFLLDFV